jgi:uncharacterized protein
MNLRAAVAQKKPEFVSLCQKHKVRTLHAFGSSLSDSFNEENSDIDLVVDIATDDPVERGQLLLSLWDSFETFFERKVYLLTSNSIKNPFPRANIERTQKLIYDRKGEKVLI